VCARAQAPSASFAPSKFCYETFEPLDDALGFIEQVACTVCASVFRERGPLLVPGAKCPLCKCGLLG
jgi:hypothetical protein